MKNITHQILFASMLILFSFCTSCSKNKQEVRTNKDANTSKSMTIEGTVDFIEFGKDGYTASITTEDKQTYKALVSIVNLGDISKYRKMNRKDQVTLKGELNSIGSKNLKVTEIVEIDQSTNVDLIDEHFYMGISPGDKIVNHLEVLTKTQMKTAEGTFDIYAIDAAPSTTTAYCLPDPNNKEIIGNIVITSSPAVTNDGIQVGSSYGDLLAKYSDLKVHGSESEGRTFAKIGNLSFRLDTPNFTYEVDPSKIKKETKIIEIIINRKA